MPLRTALCGLFIAMALGGLFTRPWNWRALVSYLLIWGALTVWASSSRRRSLPSIMWVALNSGRSVWALMHAHGSRLFLIAAWIFIMSLYNFRDILAWFGSGSATFPSGSDFELGLVCLAVMFVVVVKTGIGETTRVPDLYPRLISEMRSIVQEPIPSPKDPRLRAWSVQERFPK